MTARGRGPRRRRRWRSASASRRTGSHLTSQVGEDAWLLELDLTDGDGITTLTFSQPSDPDRSASVGPGWEYYLDRLVDVRDRGDPSLRDFERDYYPAMRPALPVG